VLAVLASVAPLDSVWEAWKKQTSELKLNELTYLLVAEDTFYYFLRRFAEKLPWSGTDYLTAGETALEQQLPH